FGRWQLGEHLLVVAGAHSKSMAHLLVLEQPAAAVGVVDDRSLEVRSLGCLLVDEVSDVRQVLDNGRGHSSADRSGDDRLAEPNAKEVRRVYARIDTRDHVHAAERKERKSRRVLPDAGGSELGITFKQRL